MMCSAGEQATTRFPEAPATMSWMRPAMTRSMAGPAMTRSCTVEATVMILIYDQRSGRERYDNVEFTADLTKDSLEFLSDSYGTNWSEVKRYEGALISTMFYGNNYSRDLQIQRRVVLTPPRFPTGVLASRAQRRMKASSAENGYR